MNAGWKVSYLYWLPSWCHTSIKTARKMLTCTINKLPSPDVKSISDNPTNCLLLLFGSNTAKDISLSKNLCLSMWVIKFWVSELFKNKGLVPKAFGWDIKGISFNRSCKTKKPEHARMSLYPFNRIIIYLEADMALAKHEM